MCRLGGRAIILPMSRPAPSSKLLLMPDPRPAPTEPGTVPVRRYRLARLRFDARPADARSRFEHLKRIYD